LACKAKQSQEAPDAVNPADPGNNDLLGQLSKQGTGFESSLNFGKCMQGQEVCQKMMKYGVKCGGWAIDMMGSLIPDLPPSLSQP
jgi:hypothetical protein